MIRYLNISVINVELFAELAQIVVDSLQFLAIDGDDFLGVSTSNRRVVIEDT